MTLPLKARQGRLVAAPFLYSSLVITLVAVLFSRMQLMLQFIKVLPSVKSLVLAQRRMFVLAKALQTDSLVATMAPLAGANMVPMLEVTRVLVVTRILVAAALPPLTHPTLPVL